MISIVGAIASTQVMRTTPFLSTVEGRDTATRDQKRTLHENRELLDGDARPTRARTRVDCGSDLTVHFEEWMEHVVKAFEVAGVVILAVGSVIALVGAAMSVSRGGRRSAYERARQDVGRAVLLGLEVLIIADIVQTVTIDPSLESALTLALIVAVRTFLSFSLEIELDGTVPWRKASRPPDQSD